MKIGFIGLGIMGESMCENIIKKHDDTVYVYDTVKEKIAAMEALGAAGCAGAEELAAQAQLIISMVPKSEHSLSVYQKILPALSKGKTCVDMSTIDPGVSVQIAAMVKAAGAVFLDAPVVKSKPAAVAGKLGIYVGGDRDAYEAVRSILLYMGENVKYMGENGKGLVMKICHNALVAQIQNGVNETLSLALSQGIPVMDYAEAISYGGGQNFYLDSKKASIEAEDYTTAFSVENMDKDIHICTALAKECGVGMPGNQVVAKVYARAMEAGYGKEDFSATIKAVRAAGRGRNDA